MPSLGPDRSAEAIQTPRGPGQTPAASDAPPPPRGRGGGVTRFRWRWTTRMDVTWLSALSSFAIVMTSGLACGPTSAISWGRDLGVEMGRD